MSGDGMQSFISEITTGLSADALWGAIAPVAPLIIILVLFCLGAYILNKNIKSAGKNKGGRIK